MEVNRAFAWVLTPSETLATQAFEISRLSKFSMDIPNAFYLTIDLEATCSDVGEVPRHEMEIIEIGVDTVDGRE